MLSIRFGTDREWWTSSKTFNRLVQSGLDSGTIPRHLECWRDIAQANGGFGLVDTERSEADQLTSALRCTAELELGRLGNVSPESEAGDYREGLLKLLQVTSFS